MRTPQWLLSGLLALTLMLSGCPDPDDDLDSTLWSTAFDASAGGWLLNVGGSGPAQLFAVGGELNGGSTIMGFDGSSWSAVDTGLDLPLLNWVHATSATDVTIVGQEGTIVHFDGSVWTKTDAPRDQNLWGVWGASSDDLWAVGGNARSDGDATILRYDGTSWTEVTIPELQKANVRAFFKVWGTSADNVYMVGQNGAVLHWDGATLTEELVGASDDLIALWGTGPDEIVAVGGRSNGIVSVFDGTEWRTENLSPLPGLNGVWMRTPGVAHIAGARGTLATLDTTTFTVTVAAEVITPNDFHAVFGDGAGTIFGVGGNLFSVAGPFEGLALQRSLNDDE